MRRTNFMINGAFRDSNADNEYKNMAHVILCATHVLINYSLLHTYLSMGREQSSNVEKCFQMPILSTTQFRVKHQANMGSIASRIDAIGNLLTLHEICCKVAPGLPITMSRLIDSILPWHGPELLACTFGGLCTFVS